MRAATLDTAQRRASGVDERAPVSGHTDGSVASAAGLTYMPALDGIRAAAVLAVMLYHGGASWMRGGYLGVDAFFVLSGFLITALLLREVRATGTIAFGAFWLRRARRLLPALGLVVLGVIAYGAFLAPADQLGSLRSDVLATLGYVTNWRLIFSGQGYFEHFAAPSPLRHAWSLAIEEQFYLVWPLVVFALTRWLRLQWRALAVLFGTLAVVSAAWMAVAYGSEGVTRVYYGTDTRAQALLVGAALAALSVGVGRARRRPGRRSNERVLAVACAVALVVTSWLWVTAGDGETWLYQGGYLLAALAVAAIVARVSRPRPGVVGAALSWSPLRWVGRISYGLYLWHWPIFVVVTTDRVDLDGTPLLLVRFALTFAAATASYYLVEMPVRRGALGGWRSWVVVPTAVGALVGALLIVTSDARPIVAAGGDDRAATARAERGNSAASEALESQRSAPAAARPPTVALVVGDSVALTLGIGIQEAGAPHQVLAWNKALMGCGITHGGSVLVDGRLETVRPDCDQAAAWFADVQELRPDVSLLLVGAWDAYDRILDGRTVAFGSPEWDATMLGDLRAAVDALSSAGGRVVLATVPHYEKRNVVNRPPEFKSAFDPWRVDHLNDLIRQVAREDRERVRILDLSAYLDPPERRALLEDGVHFGVDSRKVVGDWVAARLRGLSA